jgi:metal-responsive CopG/Arc/MetJ family transcriptional regulator
MRDYPSISIPKELTNEIDRIIKSGKHGYKTRAEFVKDALRQYLKYYDKD